METTDYFVVTKKGTLNRDKINPKLFRTNAFACSEEFDIEVFLAASKKQMFYMAFNESETQYKSSDIIACGDKTKVRDKCSHYDHSHDRCFLDSDKCSFGRGCEKWTKKEITYRVTPQRKTLPSEKIVATSDKQARYIYTVSHDCKKARMVIEEVL